MKISIIGAGNVGSTLAFKILEEELADVVLVDINGDMAKGKALDLNDACGVLGSKKKAVGAGNYSEIRGSEVVVVTAGFARRPGMTREDLLIKNAGVIKEVAGKIKENAPQSIILMVTNPLDVTTYLALKVSGFDKKRVLGMAGVLDSARLSVIVSDELRREVSSVESLVLGTHGDSMVPLKNKISAGGRRLDELLEKAKIDELLEKAAGQGGRIVSYLKGGSAYYAPAISVYKMLEAIVNDRGSILPVSAYLEGEYNLRDVCLGVPARLGKGGIEEIVEVELTKEEEISLQKAGAVIKAGIAKVITAD
ncbi:MAG: malate dehydrogenase [Candidatus Omnitrophica bacterium]|nr:malate dehydrogenase [Candidatus Omnitrophota bacterium]